MKREAVEILLVEDNEDHAELVRRALADHQISNRIRHLSDGESALDYLLRRGAFEDPALSPRPHVVLLDLRLPRVDGLEVLATLKADPDLRRIPVVVFTTSDAERDLACAYASHVNSYLVKPVGFEGFQKLMDDFGLYWLGCNAYPHA